MKVKELYEKYKNYQIILYGKNPLCGSINDYIKGSTPFGNLHYTTDAELNDREVLMMKVQDKPFSQICFSLDLKYKGSVEVKGTVYAVVEKGENK